MADTIVCPIFLFCSQFYTDNLYMTSFLLFDIIKPIYVYRLMIENKFRHNCRLTHFRLTGALIDEKGFQ